MESSAASQAAPLSNRRLLVILGLAFLFASVVIFFFALSYEQQAMTYAERGLSHPGAGGIHGIALLCGVLAGLCGGGAVRSPAASPEVTSS